MGPSVETVSRLLGLLYEAAASPQRWPEFLGLVRETAGADTAYFILIDPEQRCNFSLAVGFDPKWQKAYADYYHQRDEITDRIVAANAPNSEWAGTRSSLFSDTEYNRLEIYNDFAKPQGMDDQCAIALGGLDGLLHGGLGMMRGPRAERFGAETVTMLSILGPHITRALNLHRTMTHLRQENAELRDSVETLDLAILSLDGKGRVMRFTSAARAILDARDGLTLDHGYPRAVLSTEQARLAEMVAGAAATGQGRGEGFAIPRNTKAAPEAGGKSLWTPQSGGAILISRQPPKRPLQVVVTPFCSGEILLDERPAALVFISDPDAKPASRASVLRALYGLTPTESRLVDHLVQGHEVAAAADRMGITVETARFHLKTIFRKTGTSRQPDLIRLVLGLPGIR